jgi:ABC-type Zn uptake system ZnuABC Zn-binding protein ZnuA
MRSTAAFIILVLAVLSMIVLVTTTCNGSALPTTSSGGEPEAEHGQDAPDVPAVPLAQDEKLKVVATTSIVADVVKNVGGDKIDLVGLVPLGADPHTFEPTPRDVAAVSDAHVVFANGAGLEVFLEPLLDSAGAKDKTVEVSRGFELLKFGGENGHEQEGEGERDHQRGDPHTWTDPTNVLVWTDNIAYALKALDPANAESYEANARAYQAQLEELDTWIKEQVALIPTAERQIVTDHQLYAYFADEYDFVQVGAIVPAYSTVAEPSARELALLEDAIKDLGVKAVFVGKTVNPNLGQRVAEDTGIQVVFLYTGSLTEPGGDAGTYLEYIRYNVNTIVNTLK